MSTIGAFGATTLIKGLGALSSGFPRGKFGNRMLGGINKKTKQKLGAEMAAYYGSVVTSQLLGTNLQPDIMLEFFPIYGVQSLEVAKSDQQLRFRSIGGQFFAFQEGDNLGIRVDICLIGPLRFIMLQIIDTIYFEGIARYYNRSIQPADFGQPQDANGNFLPTAVRNFGMATASANNPNLIPIDAGGYRMVQTIPGENADLGLGDPIQISAPSWESQREPINTSAFQTGSGDNIQGPPESTTPWTEGKNYQTRERILRHKTFNVITEPEVFVNMYIETFIWTQQVGVTGRNEIRVSLLLRRYVEPPKKIYIDVSYKQQKRRSQQVWTTNYKDYKDLNGATHFIDDSRSSIITATPQSVRSGQYIVWQQGGQPAGEGNIETRSAQAGLPGKRTTERELGRRSSPGYWYKLTPQQVEARWLRDVEVSPQEIQETKYKTTVDYWEEDTNNTHRFFGTSPDQKRSGDYGLLAVNFLWRIGWIATGSVTGFLSRRTLSGLTTDPIIGRLVSIGRTVKELLNEEPLNTGTATNETFEFPVINQTETQEQVSQEAILDDYIGIDISELLEEDSSRIVTFEDVFVIPERQEIFNEMLLKGFTMFKLEGDLPLDGNLHFDDPFDLSLHVRIHTDPYTKLYTVFAAFDGYSQQVDIGMTYYLGSGGPVEWAADEESGLYYVNKSVLEEVYLYVDKLEHSENTIRVSLFMFHPARGI